MLYKTEAIILKNASLGEIDRLVVAYSKNLGKILTKAKSVRKNQAKLKGHLEDFTSIYLMIAPGKGIDVITGAETINNFSNLKKNLSALAAGYYISDLINNLIAGPEEDERIWQLLVYSFQSLDKNPKLIDSIIQNFEKNFLYCLGYGKNHQDSSFFIDSLVGRRLESKLFLQNVLRMVK